MQADTRTRVFQQIVAHIIEQSGRKLSFFVIENVEGLKKRWRGQDMPYLRKIMYQLENGLVGRWEIAHRVVNTSSFGLPQHRRRIYIVGIRRMANGAHALLNEPDDDNSYWKESQIPRKTLVSCLNPGLPRTPDVDLTAPQVIAKDKYTIMHRNTIPRQQVAIYDLTRSLIRVSSNVLYE